MRSADILAEQHHGSCDDRLSAPGSDQLSGFVQPLRSFPNEAQSRTQFLDTVCAAIAAPVPQDVQGWRTAVLSNAEIEWRIIVGERRNIGANAIAPPPCRGK